MGVNALRGVKLFQKVSLRLLTDLLDLGRRDDILVATSTSVSAVIVVALEGTVQLRGAPARPTPGGHILESAGGTLLLTEGCAFVNERPFEDRELLVTTAPPGARILALHAALLKKAVKASFALAWSLERSGVLTPADFPEPEGAGTPR